MTLEDAGEARARQALAGLGATGAAADALLAYAANPFETARFDAASLPLADAPQLEAWEEYEREAQRDGVLAALARRLVQLRFPIASGMSQTDAYLAATRRGVWPPGDSPGLSIADPGGLELRLQPTLAGRIPIVTCRDRRDFVALVRACSCRNEPERVPDSMGACIVKGLNNWDRVERLRRKMEHERGARFDEGAWGAAFKEVLAQKAQYQDRLIILSREPYSGVPAAALGMSDGEWRARSVEIRAAHECTHFFTLAAFGVMRNNLLDELIADFAGLAHGFGRYDAALALRFLGLEAHPSYREGGRFENYLKTPEIDAAAVPMLREVVVRAIGNVAAFSAGLDLAAPAARDGVVVALAQSTLVELASGDAAALLRARLPRFATAFLTASKPSE